MRDLPTALRRNMSEKDVRRAESEITAALAKYLNRDVYYVQVILEFAADTACYGVLLGNKAPSGVELEHVNEFFRQLVLTPDTRN